MKLRLTHIEMIESIVEYSGSGLPSPKLIASDKFSFGMSYACKIHIISHISWREVAKILKYRPI